MSPDERPWSSVPIALGATFALLLAAQIVWHGGRSSSGPDTRVELPPAPRAVALRLAAFGEDAAMARLAMLYLQSFDLRGGSAIPYHRLDYDRLVAWLGAILETDPRSAYPLFAAARVYAESPDPAKSRVALDFVYREYLKSPNTRWPWLAHAALLAKHRLRDLALARRYAAAIDRDTTDPSVPSWARQMEIFILEDMDELEAAKIMLGGLLASGRITDPAEAKFLRERLEQLEDRLRNSRPR
ncbi:MAG: hypothetical protein AMJ64_06160 [Betaproteobacteria bacterium SG8_39]|nr:MAG: hypothetical protein AMJ64_06160 [Betaproteobacteria bacterium SG8_39]